MPRLRHHSRTLRAVSAALLTALAALAALLTATAPAQADTTICEEFGSTVIQGRYVVQNNRWGTSATQCVTATNSGFRVTQADGSVPTNGAPKSYPSVFNGCHYTNCSPGTALPRASAASPPRRAASRTAMSTTPCTTPRTTSGWTRRPAPTG